MSVRMINKTKTRLFNVFFFFIKEPDPDPLKEFFLPFIYRTLFIKVYIIAYIYFVRLNIYGTVYYKLRSFLYYIKNIHVRHWRSNRRPRLNLNYLIANQSSWYTPVHTFIHGLATIRVACGSSF